MRTCSLYYYRFPGTRTRFRISGCFLGSFLSTVPPNGEESFRQKKTLSMRKVLCDYSRAWRLKQGPGLNQITDFSPALSYSRSASILSPPPPPPFPHLAAKQPPPPSLPLPHIWTSQRLNFYRSPSLEQKKSMVEARPFQ